MKKTCFKCTLKCTFTYKLARGRLMAPITHINSIVTKAKDRENCN